MIFTTESGTRYEFADGRVRRIAADDEGIMRRDGQWVALFSEPHVAIGHPVTLYMTPLGHGDVTIRTTTRVTTIEEEVHDGRIEAQPRGA